MRGRVVENAEQIELALKDSAGEHYGCLNFAELGLDFRLATGMKSAFELEYGHTRPDSQITAFAQLRKFATFLSSTEIHRTLPLPSDVLNRFRTWLAEQHLANASRASTLNVAIRLTSSLHRNFTGLVAKSLAEDILSFPRKRETEPEHLSEDEIKAILSICREEIDQIESRLANRVFIQSNGRWVYPGNNDLIHELLELGGGVLPRRSEMKSSLWRGVVESGGIRALYRSLWITSSDLVPFYLLILIQSAGNPDSIRNMHRTCISAHPLRDDLEWLEWFKPRADSMQRAEFPVKLRWSATGVARRLITLTENLQPRTRRRDADHLFLAMTVDRRAVTPDRSFMFLLLDAFRAKHQISDFTPKMFRATNAELHRRVAARQLATGELMSAQASADGLQSAQVVLNHKDKDTSLKYVDLDNVKDNWNATINRAQQEIEGESNTRRAGKQPNRKDIPPNVEAHQTLFGFSCKSPFEGIAPGTRAGELCDNFLHCAGCPGSLVPLDNVSVIAKLITAMSALTQAEEKATTEGWKARFDAIYQPTLRTIQQELLPRVPETILKKAAAIADAFPVPFLE